MNKSKARLSRGVRDFSTDEMLVRKDIISKIETQFRLHGFLPIETPSFEQLETLMGKYGEEGDRLIFKIINSGDYLRGVSEELLEERNPKSLLPKISEKALRYDLTIPFARYVSMNHHQLPMPFKRYQIQPVWRADRPQKGRYREFYQCDADIAGEPSLWQEVDLLMLYDDIFRVLELPSIRLEVNHRDILIAICTHYGYQDRATDIITATDKLDKIGWEGVQNELQKKNIELESKLEDLLTFTSDDANLTRLDKIASEIPEATKGISELRFVLQNVEKRLVHCEIVFAPTLARGLDYYTGMIVEVKSTTEAIGSVGGGGRYDNLTSTFGVDGIGGIGISIGLERIFYLIQESNQNPTNDLPLILFLNFGEAEASVCTDHMASLRKGGIEAELYPSSHKLKKQMTYANKKGCRGVVFIGEEEVQNNTLKYKDLKTGQEDVYEQVEDLIKEITKSLT